MSDMKNVKMTVDKKILTITIDLAKDFGPSKSGKTIVVASTLGNQSVPDNESLKIGVNVYKPKG
jgi:hypothetical protein